MRGGAMFTGIVAAMGTLLQRSPRDGECRLRIAAGTLDLGDAALGDSIAVNGCCLTVVELEADSFSADVSKETSRCTTLGSLEPGRRVNLEKSMRLGERLGGHLVSGHVDGIGELLRRESDGGSLRLSLRAPVELARYIARKGSICIDGTSLTVNEVDGNRFQCEYHSPHPGGDDHRPIPEGQQVNLEVDLVARYIERLQQGAA